MAYIYAKKRKEAKIRKKDIPQKKMKKAQPRTSSEKNCKERLEKKMLKAMIGSLGKVKWKEKKFKSQG